ncbi:MAG: hypothetical protein JO089_08035 [Alphaproteobacteria bacterium]|nr:hypothetical protein [Alphaproteobacteria bacterium]
MKPSYESTRSIRGLSLAVIFAILLMPVAPREATAAVHCSSPGGTCSAYGQECTGTDSGSGTCVPEMSDYMAAALVVTAGGLLFYIRRRSLAKA